MSNTDGDDVAALEVVGRPDPGPAPLEAIWSQIARRSTRRRRVQIAGGVATVVAMLSVGGYALTRTGQSSDDSIRTASDVPASANVEGTTAMTIAPSAPATDVTAPPTAAATAAPPEPPGPTVTGPATGIVSLDGELVFADAVGAEVGRIALPAPVPGFTQILRTAGETSYVLDGPRLHIVSDPSAAVIETVESSGVFGPVTANGYWGSAPTAGTDQLLWSFTTLGGAAGVGVTLAFSELPVGVHGDGLVVWGRANDEVFVASGERRTPIAGGGVPLVVGSHSIYMWEDGLVVGYDLDTAERTVAAELTDSIPASTLSAAALSVDESELAILTKTADTYRTDAVVLIDLAAGTTESFAVDRGVSIEWFDRRRVLISGVTTPYLFDLATRTVDDLELDDVQVSVLRMPLD